MPQPATLFSLASTAALVAWLALAVSLFAQPLRKWTWRVTGLALPALFALLYIVAITIGFRADTGGGFGSIGEVRALFSDDWALSAGWIHYLAFDLFVGTWIARNGTAAGIHALLLLPCLALTFMFGPGGLLLYLAIHVIARGRSWEGFQ